MYMACALIKFADHLTCLTPHPLPLTPHSQK